MLSASGAGARGDAAEKTLDYVRVPHLRVIGLRWTALKFLQVCPFALFFGVAQLSFF